MPAHTGPPGPDEYGAHFAGYVRRIPLESDIVEVLAEQLGTVGARLRGVPEARGGHRYAEGKWSVKEIVLHMSDTERIMAYRALRIARGDTTPLPGFDENAYVPLSGADAQSL